MEVLLESRRGRMVARDRGVQTFQLTPPPPNIFPTSTKRQGLYPKTSGLLLCLGFPILRENTLLNSAFLTTRPPIKYGR